MSIMAKLFGNLGIQQPAGAPQQTQAPVANPNAPAMPGNMPANNNNPPAPGNPTAPNSAVQATANTPNDGAAKPTPEGLEKFADLWNIKPEDQPKGHEPVFAGVTPEAIQQVAGKQDFSKVVTPELMQQISAGGEAAVAATLQAMNLMAQQTYAGSAEASMKLIETALEKQRTQFEASLPNLVRQQTVAQTLRSSNPIFNDPAAAPMLKGLQDQFQLKNPTATPEQIQAQVTEYLTGFAAKLTPQQANPQQQQTSRTKGDTDFSDWS
jgi:hypothetical protein